MQLMLPRVWGRLTAVFFANFFSLLVVAVSVAQATVLGWVQPHSLLTAHPSLYLAGAIFLYGINRGVLRRTTDCRRRGKPVGPIQRLYYATALTCLFCVSYLVLLTALWVPVRVFGGYATAL